MKRLLAVVIGLALALVGSMAAAAWLSTGTASATATATTVDRANAPTATRGSGTVSLSWAASTLASGASVGGYRIIRHHGSDAPVEVCVTTSTSCLDSSPVATEASYGVVGTIGANWEGPESAPTSFTYDDVHPVTTADVSPEPNAAGWNKGPDSEVTVSLAATDSGTPRAGVDHLSYSVDSGSVVLVPGATTSFAVSGAGTHTVKYLAVDGAGNAEPEHTLLVRIDPKAPVTTVTPRTAPNQAGWYRQPVTLDFSATDVDDSGVKSVTVDGVTTAGSTATKMINADGTSTVSYHATDNADNVEGANSLTVKVDQTDPTATINPTGTPIGGYYTSDQVTITSADATSGVAKTEYSLDGGASYQAYTGPFTLQQGSNIVRVRVADNAGNVRTTGDTTIKVDTVAPVATLSQTGSGQPTISATDTTSGVASISWRDGSSGAYTTEPGSSTTLSLSNGSHTVWYYATDNAGQQGTPTSKTITVSVDTTAPTISNLMDGGTTWHNDSNGSGSWNKDACGTGNQVCATTTDGGSLPSGIKASTIYFTLVRGASCWNGTVFVTGGACQASMSYTTSTGRLTASVPQSVMVNGTYTLKIHVEDNAGNVREESLTFTIT